KAGVPVHYRKVRRAGCRFDRRRRRLGNAGGIQGPDDGCRAHGGANVAELARAKGRRGRGLGFRLGLGSVGERSSSIARGFRLSSRRSGGRQKKQRQDNGRAGKLHPTGSRRTTYMRNGFVFLPAPAVPAPQTTFVFKNYTHL